MAQLHALAMGKEVLCVSEKEGVVYVYGGWAGEGEEGGAHLVNSQLQLEPYIICMYRTLLARVHWYSDKLKF